MEQHSGLLTDLYQITMAYGYWKLGVADRHAVFCLQFRSNPFDGGYTIAAGLEDAARFIESYGFEESDIEYLAGLTGADGKPLFERGFLDHLRSLRLIVDVDAMPEGTAAFPYEPLLRVSGPILQCQLLETALLNIINFQSLIATKAARICMAADWEPVLEFGLRRAQGFDGGLTASRAAFVGGCTGTSNVLAGKLFGIPVKGTLAHSWVMFFEDEVQAFEEYARIMPNNCLLLVDTYNTLEGVRRAAKVGIELQKSGHKFMGVRLDSGDLAYLSQQARQILDDAGLHDAAIVASNDLDEHVIASLRQQGAKIDAWGVGTRLVTAYDEPALGGVYKLSAMQDEKGNWQRRIKRSEQAAKSSIPGILQVRRYTGQDRFIADAIFDELDDPDAIRTVVDPADNTRRRRVPSDLSMEDLLIPIFRSGNRVYELPALNAIQSRTRAQLDQLHPAIKRLLNPHTYPAGLDLRLSNRRTRMLTHR